MEQIIEGFKRVFKTENALSRHLTHAGIGAIVSLPALFLDKQQFEAAFTAHNYISIIPQVLIWGVLALIYICYVMGYMLKFAHNCFDPENKNLMPKFDSEPFAIFLKALPLKIFWAGYFLLHIALVVAILQPHWILIIIVYLFMLYGFGPIALNYIAFAKDYNTKGLFDIVLPYKYFKLAGNEYWLMVMKFIPFNMAASVLSSFILVIMSIFVAISGKKEDIMALAKLVTYLYTVVNTYCILVISMVWHYRAVVLYKEEIEPGPHNKEMEEHYGTDF